MSRKIAVVVLLIIGLIVVGGIWYFSDSSKAEITAFEIYGMKATKISSATGKIDVQMPYGTDLSSLLVRVKVSPKANVSPADSTKVDFSEGPATYTVTAENGDEKNWFVTVTKAPNTETDIVSFSLFKQSKEPVISKTNHTVDAEVKYGTDLKKLVPNFKLSDQATSSPPSKAAVNFSSGSVSIVVTAGDGTTSQDWTVNVTVKAANTKAEIKNIFLEAGVGSWETDSCKVIADSSRVDFQFGYYPEPKLEDIVVKVSEGATYELKGDFPDTLSCTVTAEDGKTVKEWEIIVIMAEASKRVKLTKVVLNGKVARIDSLARTIRLEIGEKDSLNVLVITELEGDFSSIKSNLAVGDTLNFVDGAKKLVFTAQDTTVTEKWTIAVWQAESDSLIAARAKEADIRKGNGIEHVYQRQLAKSNLVKWGYIGSLSDPVAIKKWIGWRSHDLAIKCGFVDYATGKEIRVAKIGVGYSLVMDKDDNVSTNGYAEMPKDDTVKPTVINVAASSYCEAEFIGVADKEAVDVADKKTTSENTVEKRIQSYEYVYTPCQDSSDSGVTITVVEWPPIPTWPADMPI